MGTPNYVKLKNAGDAIVLHCESAKVNTSGKWPTIDFMGKDAKTHQQVVVAVPQKSAERQMERIGLDLAECPGMAIGISRAASDNPEKPYWNLAVVGEVETPKRDPSRTMPEFIPGHPVQGFTPEPPPPDDADAPMDAAVPKPITGDFTDPLYLAITRFVLEDVAPMYASFDIGPTPEAIASMVATCYINANRGR